MSPTSFPFAVRLLGFGRQETEVFDATFAVEQQGHSYLQLDDDNLQDPDLYIVNADNLKALVMLDQLRPSDVRPALLVGQPPIALPYARIERPIRWHRLYDALDILIEKRADALSRLEASDIVAVSERRRRNRVDIDLTDPAEYARMRTEPSRASTILIVDRSTTFRDRVAELLGPMHARVIWTERDAEAAQTCAQNAVAAVIIDTTHKDIDPYRVCQEIKQIKTRDRMAVIFLSSREGSFDIAKAREAGYDGFLTKPVSGPNLLNALRRFMHLAR